MKRKKKLYVFNVTRDLPKRWPRVGVVEATYLFRRKYGKRAGRVSFTLFLAEGR